MGLLTISAALLLARTAVQAKDSLWPRLVVLPPERSVAVAVREGVVYKRTTAGPLLMDIYAPRGRPHASLPAVVFVHGGPVPVGVPLDVRRMGMFRSYGRLLASHGLVAVTFSHRLAGSTVEDSAALDVRDAVRYVIEHATALAIDPNRLCLWAVSMGGVVFGRTLLEFSGRIRCLVLYYAVVEPAVFHDLVGDSQAGTHSSPGLTTLLDTGRLGLPPTLVVRVGQDEPGHNPELDRFAWVAIGNGTELELHAFAAGHHGFDVLDDSPRARDIITRTLAFVHAATASRP